MKYTKGKWKVANGIGLPKTIISYGNEFHDRVFIAHCENNVDTFKEHVKKAKKQNAGKDYINQLQKEVSEIDAQEFGNAKLISKAPEMYEALKQINKELEFVNNMLLRTNSANVAHQITKIKTYLNATRLNNHKLLKEIES